MYCQLASLPLTCQVALGTPLTYFRNTGTFHRIYKPKNMSGIIAVNFSLDMSYGCAGISKNDLRMGYNILNQNS